MKFTAVACSNIALAKYWGKRDKTLILPYNSSLSVTIAGLLTKTTVEFDSRYRQDEISIDGSSEPTNVQAALEHLQIIRDRAGISCHAKVVSQNNFPKAAGLASSASGAAALALAGSAAAGLNLDGKELSILARLGSGSASRSIHGGFVIWHKGTAPDGSDSFAEQVVKPDYWPEFRVLVVVVSTKEKSIKSRAGMSETVATSPFYQGWLDTAEEDVYNIKQAILDRNLPTLGHLAEENCLKMHATMITTRPPLIYWSPTTVSVIHLVHKLREEGVQAFLTIDAGPNVKILCLDTEVAKIKQRFALLDDILEIREAKVGEKANLIEDHLF